MGHSDYFVLPNGRVQFLTRRTGERRGLYLATDAQVGAF